SVGRLLSAADAQGPRTKGGEDDALPASPVALDTFLHAAAGLPVFAQALLADLRLALYPHAAPPAPPRADASGNSGGSHNPAPGAPS
nr:hypothetical protein [Burkholderia sp. Ac-20379]